jgi:hypothetical protein
MTPWQIYLVSKLTTLQILLGVGGLFALIIGGIFLVEGFGQQKRANGLEDPRFVHAQVVRAIGFKFITLFLICLILFLLVPSSETACQMIQQCQTKLN